MARLSAKDGYSAFISYSHAQDRLLSAALQSELERFAGSWRHPRRMRVFRDETNLAASPALWPSIVRSMAAADWFVLLASPAAAGSEWVRREVAWWVEHKGADRLLIAVTAGRLHWRGDDFDWSITDAVPGVLAGVFATEPNWVDLSQIPSSDERPQLGDTVANLAAPILGVEKDALVGEHVRHRRQLRRTVWAVGVTLTALLVAVAVASVIAVVRARAEHEQAQVSAARELAALADGMVSSDPRTALGLALAGNRIRPGPESELAVFRTLSTTRYVSTLAGHRARVNAVAFAGSVLATGADDQTLRLWDLTDPARPRPLGDPVDPGIGAVAALAFEPGTRRLAILGVHAELTGAETSRLVLWDTAEPYSQARTTPEWKGLGTSLAFLPGTGLLAVSNVDGVGTDGRIQLWEAGPDADARLLSDAAADGAGPIYSLAVSADGSTVATGNAHGDGTDSGGETGIWELADGPKLKRVATLDTGPALSVAINPAGTIIAAAGQDRAAAGSVTLWDAHSHSRLGRPTARSADQITAVAFAPDGSTLAAGSGQTALLWDVSDPAAPTAIGDPLAAHGETVEATAFSPDGRVLVTASRDAQVIVWDAGGRIRPPLAQAATDTSTGAAGPNPALRSLLVTTGTRSPIDYDAVTSVDGRTMATVDERQRVTLWHLGPDGARQKLTVLPPETPADGRVPILPQFDAAARYAITGTDIEGTGSRLYLWDVSAPREPRPAGAPLVGFTGPLTLSPDGRLLAAMRKGPEGYGVVVVLFDVTDMARPRSVATIDATREAKVLSLAFAPDGTTLAVADNAKTTLFDVSDPARPGRLGRPLAGLTGLVAFAPDGHTLAVAGDEQGGRAGLTLWDVTRRHDPRRIGDPFLASGAGGTTALAFSVDGRTLLTGGSDHTIRTWDLTSLTAVRTDPAGAVCRLTDAGLPPEVWARYIAGYDYQAGCHGKG
ncbi:toll/interleukin-1 receptor domain-containing protein [Paractinoplanes toevensis]|uniref:TIR domain-containing protein n=1 Tax=Paractinoplanes toevensis TaxID=571911 RepID=A0A919WA94_9ACTN|nr:TIR domain-containing protein [Actinoplanes toevensis]GIM96502.1 hypothetical protein Ato02nite_082950 [Actinoplanes toevensis]